MSGACSRHSLELRSAAEQCRNSNHGCAHVAPDFETGMAWHLLVLSDYGVGCNSGLHACSFGNSAQATSPTFKASYVRSTCKVHTSWFRELAASRAVRIDEDHRRLASSSRHYPSPSSFVGFRRNPLRVVQWLAWNSSIEANPCVSGSD